MASRHHENLGIAVHVILAIYEDIENEDIKEMYSDCLDILNF